MMGADDVEREEAEACLQEAIATSIAGMPKEWREVVVATFGLNAVVPMTPQQISKAIGLHARTVEVILAAALEDMRQALEKLR